MIKGAVEWINPLTKEIKQKCICGARLPLRYNQHFGCLGANRDGYLDILEQNEVKSLNNDNNAEHQ